MVMLSVELGWMRLGAGKRCAQFDGLEEQGIGEVRLLD